jgi:hypothetical protein
VPGTTDGSFTRAFLGDVLLRAALGIGAMLCSFAGGFVGATADDAWAPFAGALGGLALGVVLPVVGYRGLIRQSPEATGRDGSATHSLHEPG